MAAKNKNQARWDETIELIDPKGKKKEFFNAASFKKKNKFLTPSIEACTELESRRVWKDVAAGIRADSEKEALVAKVKLEKKQRAEEKFRTENEIEWVPAIFDKHADNYYLYKNFGAIKEAMEKGVEYPEEKIWQWDKEDVLELAADEDKPTSKPVDVDSDEE
eukprot:TRINITY_DN2815_c0_g2_i1.p1 TRINITY_DN2815_c0_g2~~TRINITY_DN2815_c0_g2_i1.p1  ORF type:complete len:163 (+),score=36.22 TRINITY_DN2815_c0_g2_i1:51-539(+)